MLSVRLNGRTGADWLYSGESVTSVMARYEKPGSKPRDRLSPLHADIGAALNEGL